MPNENWIRLGNTVINFDNVAYVELESTQYEHIKCVRIVFTAVGHNGQELNLIYAGADYAAVRTFLDTWLNNRISGGRYIPSQPNPNPKKES